MAFNRAKERSFLRRLISCVTASCFFLTVALPAGYAQNVSGLPVPGEMVYLSEQFTPAHLKGITIHPEKPFTFDFIVNQGDLILSEEEKKFEYKKLIKYFLAALAIPDDHQWVNLSPYEAGRIIENDFGRTEMGRDLLAQDYMLKQLTASLIYPEKDLGKKFWDKVYEEAYKQYGTREIPLNTFNKVWILPGEAAVYEKDNTAYIVKQRLKVMLEEDYLSLSNNSLNATLGTDQISNDQVKQLSEVSSRVLKEIIIPAIEKEVNEGKNFANLRQVYSGMLLATWYKRTLKETLLGKVYADQSKIKGIDQDPKDNEEIYQKYVEAFKKGVYNYIKEDFDPVTQELIPRKHFSGGAFGFDKAMISQASPEDMAQSVITSDDVVTARLVPPSGSPRMSSSIIAILRNIVRGGILALGLFSLGCVGSATKENSRESIELREFVSRNYFNAGSMPDEQRQRIEERVLRTITAEHSSVDRLGSLKTVEHFLNNPSLIENDDEQFKQAVLDIYGKQIDLSVFLSEEQDTFFLTQEIIAEAYKGNPKAVRDAIYSLNPDAQGITVDTIKSIASDLKEANISFEENMSLKELEDINPQFIATLIQVLITEMDQQGMGDEARTWRSIYERYGRSKATSRDLNYSPRALSPEMKERIKREKEIKDTYVAERKKIISEEYRKQKEATDKARERYNNDLKDIERISDFFRGERLKFNRNLELSDELNTIRLWFAGSRKEKLEKLKEQYERALRKLEEEVMNSKTGGVSNAQKNPGGIDFNQANLNLQIDRDGNGVELPLNQHNYENINVEGLIPVILDIIPAHTSSVVSNLTGNQTSRP